MFARVVHFPPVMLSRRLVAFVLHVEKKRQGEKENATSKVVTTAVPKQEVLP